MFVEHKQQYEIKYNSLPIGDRKLVDYILYMALGWGHAHICSSCLKKYIVLPGGIDLIQRLLVISDDYFVKKHIGEAEVCEIDHCLNEAEYDIQVNE